ncbi:MAG: tRNA lysidine(34) synthetase TilS [Leptospiraceae bacterium]|nr:tRNA lysidine(34) synthetase TilS [Leptospiraceae bacterium]
MYSSRNPINLDYFLAHQSRFLADLRAMLPAALVDQHWPRHCLVALSGGMDSMLLALLAWSLQKSGTGEGSLVWMYIHHGLRAAADLEVIWLHRLAAITDVPLEVRSVHTSRFARRYGLGLEEAGRKLRYASLQSAARRLQLPAILVAHHADDYLESLLIQFCRASGPRALQTMPLTQYAHHGPEIWRPLLFLERLQIQDLMERYQIPWLRDESNRSPRFQRNRIRSQITPLLRQEGCRPVRIWQNYHSAADLEHPPLDFGAHQIEYLQLDRNLFHLLRSDPIDRLKAILDPALNCLGLAPADRRLLHTIYEQMQRSLRKPGACFQINYKNQSLWMHAAGKGPIWLVRMDAACLQIFATHTPEHAVDERGTFVKSSIEGHDCDAHSARLTACGAHENGGRRMFVVYNHQHRQYSLAPDQEIIAWRPGLRWTLPNGQHQAVKKAFQTYRIPLFVRPRIPLIYNSQKGLVETLCLSFWEDLKDVGR